MTRSKLFSSILILLFIGRLLNAQDCLLGTAVDTLVLDEQEIEFILSGNLGFTLNSNDISIRPRWLGGIWIVGKDSLDYIKLNASSFGFFGNRSSYWPGPIIPNGSTANAASCANWDIIFRVNQADIQSFISDFEENGNLGNPIPTSIAGWPARGNPLFLEQRGFELPSMTLAPFVDINNDGIYDPRQGDYPEIASADEALWWMINTNGNIDTETAGDNLILDIQVMVYNYIEDPVLNNSLVYDIDLIQRGEGTIDSTFFGFWFDTDTSCPSQGIGCIPSENLSFFYDNGIDNSPYCTVFQNKRPLEYGVKQLRGPLAPRVFDENMNLVYPDFGIAADTFVEQRMSSFKHYYRNSSTTESFETGPANAFHYYNLLQGLWRDGQEQTFNGVPTPFAFQGNPANPQAGDTPYCENDRREEASFLMNSGPFRMEPESRHSLTYVLTKTPAGGEECPDVSNLINDLSEVEDELSEILTSTKVLPATKNEVKIFPNPANFEITFQVETGNENIKELEIYSATGALLNRAESINTKQYKFDLAGYYPGVYFYKLETESGFYYSGRFIKQ